jgi:hypothetical protein
VTKSSDQAPDIRRPIGLASTEALDYPRSRLIARQDRREVARRNQRNAIIAKQFHGLLPTTVGAELLQLALYALATYPLACAPITKMVTGKLPSDPKSSTTGWPSSTTSWAPC